MGGDGDAALHVGDAGAVDAPAFSREGAPGGRAQGEDRVVVAQQRHLRAARPFEDGVEVTPASTRPYELRAQAVAFEGPGEDLGEGVEGGHVVRRRVEVDPGLQVGKDGFELARGRSVGAPGLLDRQRRHRVHRRHRPASPLCRAGAGRSARAPLLR